MATHFLFFYTALIDIAALVLIITLLKRPIPDWLFPCLFFIQVNGKQMSDALACLQCLLLFTPTRVLPLPTLQFLPFATESIAFGFEIVRRYVSDRGIVQSFRVITCTFFHMNINFTAILHSECSQFLLSL